MDISSASCNNYINEAKHTGMIKQITEDITMAKTLIAFFSRADGILKMSSTVAGLSYIVSETL